MDILFIWKVCVIATISIEKYLFYIILAISKNCGTVLAFVNDIDQFVQYCLCDFFNELRWYTSEEFICESREKSGRVWSPDGRKM